MKRFEKKFCFGFISDRCFELLIVKTICSQFIHINFVVSQTAVGRVRTAQYDNYTRVLMVMKFGYS